MAGLRQLVSLLMWVQTAAAAAAAGQGQHSKVRDRLQGLGVTGMGQGLKGCVDCGRWMNKKGAQYGVLAVGWAALSMGVRCYGAVSGRARVTIANRLMQRWRHLRIDGKST